MGSVCLDLAVHVRVRSVTGHSPDSLNWECGGEAVDSEWVSSSVYTAFMVGKYRKVRVRNSHQGF